MAKKPYCTICGSFLHYQTFCLNKPNSPPKRTPIKKIGKHYKLWFDTKTKWFERNKAPYYWCHYCDKQLTKSQLTLDHKEARSRRPELRYKLSNLVPCCWNCNTLKGSLSHDEYVHTCNT